MGPSINQFLEVHSALIRRLARQTARPPLNGEDVAQDVMVALLRWHEQGSFDPKRVENVEAYLRVVVRNAASRVSRRAYSEMPGRAASPTEELEPPGPPAYEPTFAHEALEARALLDRLKASLAPRDALAFALLVEDGLDLHQVAAALGTSVNNVYQMRHRIRTRARELLDRSRNQV